MEALNLNFFVDLNLDEYNSDIDEGVDKDKDNLKTFVDMHLNENNSYEERSKYDTEAGDKENDAGEEDKMEDKVLESVVKVQWGQW